MHPILYNKRNNCRSIQGTNHRNIWAPKNQNRHWSQNVRQPIHNLLAGSKLFLLIDVLPTYTYFTSLITDCKFKILDNTSCYTDSCIRLISWQVCSKNTFRMTIAEESTTAILQSKPKKKKSKSTSGNDSTSVVTNQMKF